MKRIAICIIIAATGLTVPQVVAPQVSHAIGQNQGCPINNWQHGLYNVDQCLKPGGTGNTNDLSDRLFKGIEVSVHSVSLKGGDVLVDATVKNNEYIDSCAPRTPDCGGLVGNGAFPCPAPPWLYGDTCHFEPITVGQWAMGIYDKNWQGAPLSPISTSGNVRLPSTDTLSAKCADVTKCSWWEDIAAYLCIGDPTAAFSTYDEQIANQYATAYRRGDVSQVDALTEEHPWLKGFQYQPGGLTRNTVDAAVKQFDAAAAACGEEILIRHGKAQSGELGFEAANVRPGQNIAIFWNYGGVGFAWTCQVDKKSCKGVKLPPPPPCTSNQTGPNCASPPTTPSVTSVTPNSGPSTGGTAVFITGTNLDQGGVSFGGESASSVSCGPAACNATSPQGTGTVNVTVRTSAGASVTSPATQFTYTSPPPPNNWLAQAQADCQAFVNSVTAVNTAQNAENGTVADVVRYAQAGLQAYATLASQLDGLNGPSGANGGLSPGLSNAAQNAQTVQAILDDLSGLDQSEAFSGASTAVDSLLYQTQAQDQQTREDFNSVGLTNCAQDPAP